MPIYIDKVSPQGARAGGGVRATPGAFGGSEAQALGNVGQALGQTAGQVNQIFAQAKKEREATELLDRQMQYSDALQKYNFKYQQERQGEAALTAAQDYDSFAKDELEKIMGTLSSDRQRQAFEQQVFPVRRAFAGNGMSYQLGQERAWKDDTRESYLMQGLDLAKNPNSTQEARDAAWNDYINNGTQLQPYRPKSEWMKDKERFRLASVDGVIERDVALALAKPEEALRMLGEAESGEWGKEGKIPEAYQNYFTPTEYAAHLANLRTRAEGQLKQNKTAALNALYEPMWQQVKGLPRDEALLIFNTWTEKISDQETRSGLRTRFDSDMAIRDEKQKGLDGVLGAQILAQAKEQGMSLAQVEDILIPQALKQGISQSGLEQLEKMLKQGVDKETPENLRAYNQVMRDIDNKKILTREQMETAVFFGGLNTVQSEYVRNVYFPEGGKEGQTRAKWSAVNSEVKRYNPKIDLEKAPWLYDQVVAELDSGPVTDQSVREATARVMREVAVPGRLWGEREMRQYQATRDNLPVLGAVIPEQTRERITRVLQLNGIENPTEQQIQEHYDKETRPQVRSLYGR